MSILILIISSNNLSIYNEHKNAWIKYMNKNKNFDCYFIEYRNDINIASNIVNNHIYLSGNDTRGNIITKTLDSIEYFIN